MAQITIDINDAQLTRVRDKAALALGVPASATNAQKVAAIKQGVANYLKMLVLRQESDEAQAAALQAGQDLNIS